MMRNIIIIGMVVLSSCATTKVEKKCCNKESRIIEIEKSINELGYYVNEDVFNGNLNEEVYECYAKEINRIREYNTEVTDSYGNEYQNWFETAHEAWKWIYYVWDKEDWFNSANSQELLANAIHEAHRIDRESGILSGNRDGLD
jgi:hypothetical protein